MTKCIVALASSGWISAFKGSGCRVQPFHRGILVARPIRPASINMEL
jgi:hypothetical protein